MAISHRTRFFMANLTYWLLMSLLLVTQTAHADFRKALDAYIARDGATMLKEVKDAVDKKNDDGLILLLMATNMDAATSYYDETTKQPKSTLRAILPQPKWDEMRELLMQATNNSSVDAQYYFNINNYQFGHELMIQRLQAEQIKRGEQPKKEYTNQERDQAYSDAKKSFLEKGWGPFNDNTSISSITKQAEAGDPEYQAILGFFNLGFPGDYAYQCETKEPAFTTLCEMKVDEAKGYEWLRKAVKGYELDGLLSEGYGKFASNMCKFLKDQKNLAPKDLRQAYLWCFMGANLGSGFSEDWLHEMYRTGQLKMVAPQLDAAWEQNKNAVLYVKNIKEWPDMVLEVRRRLTAADIPVFSYLFVGITPSHYGLEVYKDGRVFFKDFRQLPYYKTLITRVSPKQVKDFLSEISKTGVGNWSLFPGRAFGCTECRQSFTLMNLSLVKGKSVRRLLLASRDQRDEISLRDEPRMARIKALVDRYFPTRQLRIDLGNGGKLQKEKLVEESKWIELAKRGE